FRGADASRTTSAEGSALAASRYATGAWPGVSAKKIGRLSKSPSLPRHWRMRRTPSPPRPEGRDQMRYMFMINHDEAALAKAPPSLWGEYAAFNEALAKAGGAPGGRLQGSNAATTVRVRNGKNTVQDGPFADTKERLAGFYTMDLPDLD